MRRHRAELDQLHAYEHLRACIEALVELAILSPDREAALISHSLERQHIRIGTMDPMTAAIYLAHDATLLTRNLTDFDKVLGLRVENWLD